MNMAFVFSARSFEHGVGHRDQAVAAINAAMPDVVATLPMPDNLILHLPREWPPRPSANSRFI
jgi:hypothetical protein